MKAPSPPQTMWQMAISTSVNHSAMNNSMAENFMRSANAPMMSAGRDDRERELEAVVNRFGNRWASDYAIHGHLAREDLREASYKRMEVNRVLDHARRVKGERVAVENPQTDTAR